MNLAMIMDWDRKRIIERQKAECREKIEFHTKNVILQSMISFLCVAGGMYAGQKKSIAVPLVLAPTAAASCKELTKHESKRRQYKEILKTLEKE